MREWIQKNLYWGFILSFPTSRASQRFGSFSSAPPLRLSEPSGTQDSEKLRRDAAAALLQAAENGTLEEVLKMQDGFPCASFGSVSTPAST